MVRPDYFDNTDNLPEYYDGMYLDGFEPWQIMEAHRRTMSKRFLEQRQKQQPDDYTINFNTNVRIRR
jgi:hypothetical protein